MLNLYWNVSVNIKLVGTCRVDLVFASFSFLFVVLPLLLDLKGCGLVQCKLALHLVVEWLGYVVYTGM